MMLFRAKSLKFVKEWIGVIDKDLTIWDQNAFNDLIRRGSKPLPDSANNYFEGDNGALKVRGAERWTFCGTAIVSVKLCLVFLLVYSGAGCCRAVPKNVGRATTARVRCGGLGVCNSKSCMRCCLVAVPRLIASTCRQLAALRSLLAGRCSEPSVSAP